MTTLRELCAEWLGSLPVWSRCARPGGGLTATVVIRQLLYPAVQERWRSAPALQARLSAEETEQAFTVLRWLPKIVGRQVEQLRVAIDEGVAEALARDVEVSVTLLGDKLVRALARLETSGEPVSEAELAGVASTYLDNRPPRGRMLPRDEFVQYEPRFQRLWDRVGKRNMTDFPPSAVALGRDERPPFVRSERENTWCGLDRSVYSRFRKAAGDAHVSGSPDDIARLEVRRACGRLGLTQESALVALHSLALGITLGPFDAGEWLRPPTDTFDESWKDDREPLKPRASVAEDSRFSRGGWVHADIAAYAQACVAKFVAQEQQGRYLRRQALMETAREHAMRRAWMICFEHDRRRVGIDGRAATRLVSLAIYKGIPSGQAYLRRRRMLVIHQEQVAVGEEIDQRRLGDTLAWLAEHREIVAGLLTGDRAAVACYEERAISHGLLQLDILLSHFGKDQS